MGNEIEWTDEFLECHRQAAMTFEAVCGWSEERLPLSMTLYRLCAQASGDGQTVSAVVHDACLPSAKEIVVWATRGSSPGLPPRVFIVATWRESPDTDIAL